MCVELVRVYVDNCESEMQMRTNEKINKTNRRALYANNLNVCSNECVFGLRLTFTVCFLLIHRNI